MLAAQNDITINDGQFTQAGRDVTTSIVQHHVHHASAVVIVININSHRILVSLLEIAKLAFNLT
jgi:hypothetical protein